MRENKLTHVPTASIQITREQRQRTDLTPDSVLELAHSIAKTQTLISPISIDRETLTIIAGERRLTAFRLLESASDGDWTVFSDPAKAKELLTPVLACPVKLWEDWSKIPALLYHDITTLELQILEWTENVQRLDLPWQDRAKAALQVHRLCLEDARTRNERWADAQTAAILSISPSGFSQLVSPLRELAVAGDKTRAHVQEAISKSGTPLSAARSAVAIKTRHGEQLATSDGRRMRGMTGEIQLMPREVGPAPKAQVDQLLCADFTQWAPAYAGQTFNFLHCDFPYGIEFNSGRGMGTSLANVVVGTYDDSPDVYFALLDTLLACRQRLLAPSAHIMFWFSQNLRRETEDRIQAAWPDAVVSKFLLVWHMNDNSGLLPTPKEGRRTYETAMQITLGERPLASQKAMSFAGPRGRDKVHRSQKSIECLEHFLPMYVDTSTRMLDPTAGSATSMIVAHRLGATVTGLEIDAEMHAAASQHFAQETL